LIIESAKILDRLGYNYYKYSEPEVVPDTVSVTFLDMLPFINKYLNDDYFGNIGRKRLYKHQWEAYGKLAQGYNVILRSGTGSGKTEAWVMYSIIHRKKVLAIYPTLALANDQLYRLNKYSKAAEIKVVAIDAKRKNELYKDKGSRSKVIKYIAGADIVVTNPAFLILELKKIGSRRKVSILEEFLRKVDVIVLDEFDFYGPREIALLFSMIKLLREFYGARFQIVLLTATLENAHEVARYFTGINSKPTSIIEGKAFKVKNILYVILGKNLERVWSIVKREFNRNISNLKELGEDILKALEDFEYFRENVYKVLSIAEAMGLKIPWIEFDPCELLTHYLNDDGVTLVFTRSIAKAEEIYRKLRSMLPEDKSRRVAAHHHLVSKDVREKIEEGARSGKIKVIISPRTLSQGIDIGTIVRIVHIGLPENVREYWQREGRKGRRTDIKFTETIIIPLTRWDRYLLSRGLKALIEWTNLPLEKTIVNPHNKYSLLFEALFKFISPELRGKLTEEEYRFLKELGLVSGAELTKVGKMTWRNMNFYEFSPPYGIKRIKRLDDEKQIYLEDVSHCDLVERFQPGCIDYSSDSIVTFHNLGGRSGRVVTAVIEEPLNDRTLWKYDPLAEAYEEYAKIKRKWGESPSFYWDYVKGHLHSEVICVVYAPKNGFGKLTKFPNRVVWFLTAPRPIIKTIGGKSVVFRNIKTIEVPAVTNGKYSDYTYGISVELDPKENIELMRIGMAYLMVILRKEFGIPFDTIDYSLHKLGERKLLLLHEPESAGLLELLDWSLVAGKVKEYEPEEIDEILLLEVDENAYLDFVEFDFNWDLAKSFALRSIEYLLLRQNIELKIKGKSILIPKPSRALRTAVIDVLELPFDEQLRVSFFIMGVYDGDDMLVSRGFKEVLVTSAELEDFEDVVRKLINEGFKLVVFSKSTIYESLEKIGLRSIIATIRGLEQMGLVEDVESLAKDVLELQFISLEELESALGLSRNTSLVDVLNKYFNSLNRIKEVPVGKWKKFTRFLGDTSEKAMKENLKNIYLLYFILKKMKEEKT